MANVPPGSLSNDRSCKDIVGTATMSDSACVILNWIMMKLLSGNATRRCEAVKTSWGVEDIMRNEKVVGFPHCPPAVSGPDQ